MEGTTLAVTRDAVVHDWIHVHDVVAAVLRAMVRPGLTGEVINVATGRQATNDDVVTAVERATGRAIARSSVPFTERPWDSYTWVADVSKAEALLDWRAATTLEDGIAQTCGWFREHLAEYPLAGHRS
jgi:nucleoside-diphosphate-sugar epimerase